jgi:NAD(P)-dependent dehydrogenase (short-subunit alcohol dehydrogenase family)
VNQFADLSDRVVVITGAGQGIGRGIALACARGGARVAALDVNSETIQAVCDEIKVAGGQCLPVQADCLDYRQLANAAKRIEDELGVPDCLVNNAAVQGIEQGKRYWELPPELITKVVSFNLGICAMPTRAFLEGFVRNSRGSIVNVASDAGRAGERSEPVYSAAKAGVIGLTKALAKSAGKYGVRVNAVSPATTATPFTDSLLSDDIRERMKRAYPLGRLGEPGDIAAAVRFLLSDESSWVTGQTLSVNGGYYM